MGALATWETSRRTRKACGIVQQQQGGTAPTLIPDTPQVSSFYLHFCCFYFRANLNKEKKDILGVKEGNEMTNENVSLF